jgi:1-deoxy-D-xylulose-5-phosphate reductoisomerase
LGITRVAIAGSTGSIGTQTLDYIAQCEGQFEVVGLGVGTSAQAVIAQAQQWKPKVVAVADEAARKEVAQALPGVEVVSDQSVLAELADISHPCGISSPWNRADVAPVVSRALEIIAKAEGK